MEAEALAEKLRSQLSSLRDAQSRQQRSSQERLSALQAHLQSLASRVVRPESQTELCRPVVCTKLCILAVLSLPFT